jgi:hypothetical protein
MLDRVETNLSTAFEPAPPAVEHAESLAWKVASDALCVARARPASSQVIEVRSVRPVPRRKWWKMLSY